MCVAIFSNAAILGIAPGAIDIGSPGLLESALERLELEMDPPIAGQNPTGEPHHSDPVRGKLTMLPNVRVPRKALAVVLKQLAKFVRGGMRHGDAVLSFANGFLQIEVAGQTSAVEAAGHWTGPVRVSARFLLGIAPRLPSGDTIELRVEAGRFHVGPISATCVWGNDTPPQIELPLDPPITMILALANRHTAEEIVRSGQARLLKEAQDRRDRLVLRAAEILRPLGVAPDDLLEVIDEAVARLHPAEPKS